MGSKIAKRCSTRRVGPPITGVTHEQVAVLDEYVTILIDQRLNLKRFDGSFSLRSGSSALSSSSISMMTTDSVLAEL